jgi:hypothetical protein
MLPRRVTPSQCRWALGLREFREGQMWKRQIGVEDDTIDADGVTVFSWAHALKLAIARSDRPSPLLWLYGSVGIRRLLGISYREVACALRLRGSNQGGQGHPAEAVRGIECRGREVFLAHDVGEKR